MRYKTKNPSIVSSFSYPSNKIETVEKINDICARRNISFSQFIMELFENQILKLSDKSKYVLPDIYDTRISTWKPFYDDLTEEKYKLLDISINWLFNYHNSRLDTWIKEQ